MSDAEESAWVECAMSEPSSVKEIRLYFNPDLSIERVNLKGEKFSDHHGMFPKEQMPPELVRRYTVSVDVDGRWEKVVDIRGNLRRLAVHKLDRTYRTGRVRVDLLETWGSPYFELFEIRIYPKEG